MAGINKMKAKKHFEVLNLKEKNKSGERGKEIHQKEDNF